MFTGIIKKVGKIKAAEDKNQSMFVSVSLPRGWKLKKGGSISINGICSTVRSFSQTSFEVEYMPETIAKTTVATWAAGTEVNLEQSLRLNDFVDGHLVVGHIDATAQIVNIEIKGDSKVFTIKVPKEFLGFIAPKGSIALDGVSLTVVDVADDGFSVSLVSYTLSNTNFGAKKAGGLVNIETDMMAKYIYNIMKHEKR